MPKAAVTRRLTDMIRVNDGRRTPSFTTSASEEADSSPVFRAQAGNVAFGHTSIPDRSTDLRTTSIMANLPVADIAEAKGFYTDYLGLETEEFNMGWVARYASPDTKTSVQLVTRDATAPEDAVISVLTDDIQGAYEEAQQLGYEIVYPLTTESWGHRRFFVRAPDGNVINVGYHPA